jgi:hypothetical protein
VSDEDHEEDVGELLRRALDTGTAADVRVALSMGAALPPHALEKAAEAGRADMVQVLLDHVDRMRHRALRRAVLLGHMTIALTLAA